MLNLDKLRKKTREASARIELERAREEERLRQEAEARRMEAERLRLEDERKAQLQKLAMRTWKEILKSSIKAAAQGGRSVQLEVSSDAVDALQAEVHRLGIASSISLNTIFTSNWGLTLQRRLNVLAEKIGSSPYAGTYMERLSVSALPCTKGGLSDIGRRIAELLREMEGDPEDESPLELKFVLSDDARSYIKLHLWPHLAADVASTLTAQLEVRWKAKDVLRAVMVELYDVPAWLLSNGGSGLMERIGQCMGTDADRGRNESVFELYSLPKNPDRWGDNAMTKFVHNGQPVGVSPFPIDVFVHAMELLGFKVLVKNTPEYVTTLTLRW